jgi:uncharacterized membrane protein YkoI
MSFRVMGVGLLIAWLCGSAQADPPPPRVCFTTAEARDKIAAHGLSDPLRLVRGATRSVTAEIVGVELCLWNHRLVYEISLLPRDGHVGRVYIDARTGETVGTRDRN